MGRGCGSGEEGMQGSGGGGTLGQEQAWGGTWMEQVGRGGDAALDPLCSPQSVPSCLVPASLLCGLCAPTPRPSTEAVEAGAERQPRPCGEPEVRRKPWPPGPPQLWEQMSCHSRQPSGRGDSWPNLTPILATVLGALVGPCLGSQGGPNSGCCPLLPWSPCVKDSQRSEWVVSLLGRMHTYDCPEAIGPGWMQEMS